MSDKDAKIFFEKALKFFNEKKFDLAEKNFEDALKLAPGRVSILENLASIYLINKTEKGIVGDVAFDEVSKNAKALTPVPGGVGPMTIACLLKNTIDCFKRSQ